MKTCELCGSQFESWPVIDGKRRNFQKRKYCLKCSPFKEHNTKRLESPRPKTWAETIQLECAFCGKFFQRKLKYVTNARKNGKTKFYCGLSCINKKEVFWDKCHECGKLMPVTQKRHKTKSGFHYCSSSCANSSNNRIYKTRENHPNWKDGSSTYRSLGLSERCEDCGETRYYLLVVHHINKDRNENGKENLVTVCHNCHVLRHLVVRNGKLCVHWGTLTTQEAKDFLRGGVQPMLF